MSQLHRRRGLHVAACLLGFLYLFIARPAPADDRPQPASGGDVNLPADALVMRPQMLFDPVLNLNACSVIVPDKWKMDGQIIWSPRMPTPYRDMVVFDPAQHLAWRQFPRLLYVDGVRENWIRQFPNRRAEAERRFAEGTINQMGMEIRKQPHTPREYVEKLLVPKLLPEVAAANDVSVVSETDLPEFAKAQTDADPFHRQVQSSRFRITYTTPNGPVEREFVSSVGSGKIGDGPFSTIMWFADVSSSRAPKGKLDALLPTFATIQSSVTLQLPWYNAQCQVAEMFIRQQQKNNDQVLQDQRDEINRHMKVMHDLATQASADLSDRIRNNFANQQKAKEEAHTQFMHYVNNTASFSNPNDGSKVTLSSNYRYQYINNHNEIIQTNDPTFHPPIDPSTSWQQMEPAK